MAIITKRRKAYSVVYEIDGIKTYETYYDYKLAKKRKEQIENQIYSLSFDKDTLFMEYLYLFINIKGREIWSVVTYEHNISIVKNYISKVIKNQRIGDVDDEFMVQLLKKLKHVKAVENHRNNEFMTQDSIHRARSILLKACDELVYSGIIKSNPIPNIQLDIKEKSKQEIVITQDEVNKLLESCDNPKLFLVLHLILGTDIKVNEMLCLTIDDIHIEDELYVKDEAYITINKVVNRVNLNTLQLIRKEDIIEEVKNKSFLNMNSQLTVYRKEERNVLLPKYIADILRQYIKDRKIFNQKYLFTNQDGNVMDRRVLNKQIYKYLEKNHLHRFNMNQLRNWSNQNFDQEQTNREHFYKHYNHEIELPMNKMVVNKKINLELKAELPKEEQKSVNRFVNALKEDEELKMKLIQRLKELQ